MPDFGSLGGEGFDPSLVADPVVDFYEKASGWRLDVWSQWSPVAWPFGWVLSAVFARRLRQLSLPLRPLETAKGMDSRVLAVFDSANAHLGSAWLRTLRATGQAVYSGWYGTITRGGGAGPGTEMRSKMSHAPSTSRRRAAVAWAPSSLSSTQSHLSISVLSS